MLPSSITFVVAVLGALADAIALRPLPAVAEPSPLLAAVGMPRPVLRGGACSAGRSPWPRSLRARWRDALNGAPRSCVYQLPPAGAFETAIVVVDGRGRPRHVTRTWSLLGPAAARRTADSVLAAGGRLPGARPFGCVRAWRPSWVPPEMTVVRGWRAAGYVAIVSYDGFSPHDLSPVGLRIDVFEGERFVPCDDPRPTPPRAPRTV